MPEKIGVPEGNEAGGPAQESDDDAGVPLTERAFRMLPGAAHERWNAYEKAAFALKNGESVPDALTSDCTRV